MYFDRTPAVKATWSQIWRIARSIHSNSRLLPIIQVNEKIIEMFVAKIKDISHILCASAQPCMNNELIPRSSIGYFWYPRQFDIIHSLFKCHSLQTVKIQCPEYTGLTGLAQACYLKLKVEIWRRQILHLLGGAWKYSRDCYTNKTIHQVILKMLLQWRTWQHSGRCIIFNLTMKVNGLQKMQFNETGDIYDDVPLSTTDDVPLPEKTLCWII